MTILFAPRHRWVVPAVAAVLLLLTAAAIILPRWGPWASPELRVRISGLPPGVSGNVLISGPGGTHRFTDDESWRTEPGRYTMTIDPVHHDHSTHHPTDTSTEINIPTAGATIAAEYRVEIADWARIAPEDPSPVAAVNDTAGRTEVVLTPGRYANALRPGEVIVSGPAGSVPRPFAARVNTVHQREGMVVATVQPVPIHFAVPRFVLRLEPAPRPVAAVYSGQPEFDDSELLAEAVLKETCAGAIPAIGYRLRGLNPELTADIHTAVHNPVTSLRQIGRWLTGRDYSSAPAAGLDVGVRLSAGLSGRADIKLQAAGKVECKGEHLLKLAKLNSPMCSFLAKLPKVFKKVIGEPKCDLRLHSEFSLSATGGLTVTETSRFNAMISTDTIDDDSGSPTLDTAEKPSMKATPNNGKPVLEKTTSGLVAKADGTVKTGPEASITYMFGFRVVDIVEIKVVHWASAGLAIETDPIKNTIKFDQVFEYELSLGAEVPLGADPQAKWKPLVLKDNIATLTFPKDTRFAPSPRRKIPQRLTMPDHPNGTVSDSLDTSWTAGTVCPGPDGERESYLESDKARTDFLTAIHDGEAKRTWQLGVYPTSEQAHSAYTEIHALIDGCLTGGQSYRVPRNDLGADAAFIKTFHNPGGRPGDIAYTHTTYVVARVDNTVTVLELDEHDVPITDPQAPDDHAAEQMREFLTTLCEKDWWCAS